MIVQAIQRGTKQLEVAKIFKVSQSTVSQIWKRYKERGAIVVKKSPGRPVKTTARQDRLITELSKKKSSIDRGSNKQ